MVANRRPMRFRSRCRQGRTACALSASSASVPSASAFASASSPPLRHRERVVAEKSMLLLVVVPFIHRVVDDPGEREAVARRSARARSPIRSRAASPAKPENFLGSPAAKNTGIAVGFESKLLAQRLSAFRADVLTDRTGRPRRGRFPRARRCSQVQAGLRPAPTSSCDRRTRGCRRPWARGCAHTRDLGGSFSSMPAKILNPEPRKCSETSAMIDRVAQVRLVGAVFADRLVIGECAGRSRRSPACRRRIPRTSPRMTGSMAMRTRHPARRSSSRRRAGRTRPAGGRRAASSSRKHGAIWK